MNANSKHSLINAFRQDKQQAKDNEFYPHGTKVNAVFAAFRNAPKTMLAVQSTTGIKRTTICGHVGQFRKKGLITAAYKAPCTVTGNKAKYFKIIE